MFFTFYFFGAVRLIIMHFVIMDKSKTLRFRVQCYFHTLYNQNGKMLY